MEIKKSSIPTNTVTRTLTDIDAPTGNIYESVVVIARRANQIASEIKQELNRKLADFSSVTDSLEETFENREQIEISKYYERLPKPTIVAVLGTVNGEKVTLLAVCGKNAVASGIKAGDIIRNIAPIVGGKGGGKPDSAMGGGTNALKLDDALAAVDDFVAEHLK